MNWLDRLRAGLARTRAHLTTRIRAAVAAPNPEFFDQLDAVLIEGDVGVAAAHQIVHALKARPDAHNPTARVTVLRDILLGVLGDPVPLRLDPPPAAILMLGVNGVGKTTSIGKLAYRLKADGRTVLLAAADTFRAAAIEQLTIWAQRAGCDLVKHAAGADPAAVIYDAAQATKARGIDVLIADTAGRLHTQRNLIEELRKINRVLSRELPNAPVERLLVLDATTGQNAIAQARIFNDAVAVTGIVLAKLDGSAKGGVVLAIASELGLPVKFVGLGEGIDELQPFDPPTFVDALLPLPEE